MGILRRPLLYLSYYLHRHRGDYYRTLQAVRDYGDWEGWLKFFLQGVAEVATLASQRARTIVQMREQHRRLARESLGRTASNGLILLDHLYRQPLVQTRDVTTRLQVTAPTAGRLLDKLVSIGILQEITGRTRYRTYAYHPYLSLFADLETG